MTSIFELVDYREFLRNYLKNQPRAGWGLPSSWARELRIHPTYMSQILSGAKDINLEIAEELGRKIHLSELELDYFLMLVQASRAGTISLKKFWDNKIRQAQKNANQVTARLKDTEKLQESAQVEFYSSALYSALRNLCALKEMKNVEDLAGRMQIPISVAQRVLEFLVAQGLVVKKAQGLEVGPMRTHVPASSPLVTQHHQNWRHEGFRKMAYRKDSDLFFTFPMSLSLKDSEKVKMLLLEVVQNAHKIVEPSPSQVVRCLNIDFFEW